MKDMDKMKQTKEVHAKLHALEQSIAKFDDLDEQVPLVLTCIHMLTLAVSKNKEGDAFVLEKLKLYLKLAREAGISR